MARREPNIAAIVSCKIARMNLARLAEENVQRHGEYVSLAFEGREWTNVEQQRAANRFAHALRRLGLAPGDRVVVLLPNGPEVLQAYAGILKAGGVIVPVVFLLSPEEVRHILADAEATVVVTAPEFLQGYYRLPEETAGALRHGWLHTGDMGRLDADGYLYIVERKKDLIIRGGFNIYPREVEEVLYAHPAVAEAAVVGRRDPLMGEEVVAFVALKPGAGADEAALIGFCQERLAKYKCPRQVRLVDALPKSPIGKILRKELRARAG
jgi:acyl-CoA synthetase (AMP-forming)/AMP-acid ligase II